MPAGSVVLMAMPSTQFQAPPFSLSAGGPFFQLLRRSVLCGEGLELLCRRTVALTLFAWLPLLVLSALKGQVWDPSIQIPFLLDAETHARFLVALPLVVIAEFTVHRYMGEEINQFQARHLIPEEAMDRFQRAKISALRLRDSFLAEALLVALVYLLGGRVIARFGAVSAETWQLTSPGSSSLSPAGIWLTYVSLPLFRFLIFRWYFRLFIWARFLWQVSRMDLRLVPTHPDGAGGLGFLDHAVTAFLPLAVAHGAVLSGFIAQRIFHAGASLPHFGPEIATFVALVFCLLVAPMLVFMYPLVRTHRKGLAEYGGLAAQYVGEFDRKWLRGGNTDEQLVGTPDIQSLADLGSSFEVVQGMKIIPVTPITLAWLLGCTLAPVAPLVLTMMPLEELLQKLYQILI